MRGLALLLAVACAMAGEPRYTLNVEMASKKTETLSLWYDQEPADAVAAFASDHFPNDDADRETAVASMLDHLCERFACARRSGRAVLFPLDLTLPGSGKKARCHVHEGDAAAAFANATAIRHGFEGQPLVAEISAAVQTELDRRANARWESDDLYVVLGIARDAEHAAIKRKFRAESLVYHPDKPTADAAIFLKLSAAYEVLGDAEKRRQFDDELHRKAHPPPPQRRRRFVVPQNLFGGQVFFFQFS